jgi:hypothetical protein
VKRIVDDESRPGSLEDWLADLVRATPRLEEDYFALERVRQRVLQPLRRTPRPRRVSFAMGVALAIIATVAVAAAAVAIRAAATREGKPEISAGAGVAPPGAVVASAPSNGDVEAPDAAAVDAVEAHPAGITDPTGPSVALDPKATGAAGDGSSAAKPVASMEDPKLVLDAIRKLRSSRDPAASGALLAQYLKTHPRGALAEDALALSIEAASAQRDAGAAAGFGRRYLTQFPNRRFRGVALRAVEANVRC